MTIITIKPLCNLGYKLWLFSLCFLLVNCNKTKDNESSNQVLIQPISHGTLVLEYEDLVIYVDPVGGFEAFEGQKAPGLILITDIHGDHLNIETLKAINTSQPHIIVPDAVAERLPDELKTHLTVISNYESKTVDIENINLGIEAIPMYNLREEALQFHEKGRGNGYVLSLANQRIYISGDTEDIIEMRELKNIDHAFVCMNLPWTMTIESAASAVLDFKPKKIYPYHYKGTNGKSDINKFKEIVSAKNDQIDVRLLNWYPNR